MTPAALDLRTATVAAILNTSSGSCDASSEGKLRALLAEAGIVNATVWAGDAELMATAFTEALALSPDLLIVLGGDGTIRTGAEACTSAGPLLIPLPGGTMNMLPKALYGNRGWEEALRATLAAPYVKPLSGGSIGTAQFFIAAVIGAPVLWTHAREALRAKNFSEAIDKGVVAFQNMLASKVRYTFSEQASGEAEAIAVICPLISDLLEDTEHTLEAAVIQVEDAAGVLSLASSSAFGKWRDDEHVSIVKTREITISADSTVPVIIDGESIDVGSSVSIRFVPEAFKALVPRPE